MSLGHTWATQQFSFWNPQGAEPSQGTSVTPKAPQGREPGQALPRRERPGSRRAWGTLTEQARSEGWSHTPELSPCSIFHLQRDGALATLTSASDGAGGRGSCIRCARPRVCQCCRKPMQPPSSASVQGQCIAWKQVLDHVALGEEVSEKTWSRDGANGW